MTLPNDTVYRHPYQDFWESLVPGDLVYVCEGRFGLPYVFHSMKFRERFNHVMDTLEDPMYPMGETFNYEEVKHQSSISRKVLFNLPYEFVGFRLQRTSYAWTDPKTQKIIVNKNLPNRTTFKTGLHVRLQPFPLELLNRVQLMEYNNMRELMNLQPVTLKRR